LTADVQHFHQPIVFARDAGADDLVLFAAFSLSFPTLAGQLFDVKLTSDW
jgi:hypothetical protein